MPRIPTPLLTALTRASHSPALLHSVLTDLLTPTEYADLIERYRICQHLAAGATIKDITEEFGVASATVVRGNRVLKYGTGGLAKVLQKK